MNSVQAISIDARETFARESLAIYVAKSFSAINKSGSFLSDRVIIWAQECADDRNVARCEGIVYSFFSIKSAGIKWEHPGITGRTLL